MYHQLRHAEPMLLFRGEIQIADDSLAPAWMTIGGQQVPGAAMCQLPQNLLTDRCYFVEFTCRTDQFTYLLLFFPGQLRPPLGRRHWLRNGSTSGSWRLSASGSSSAAAASPLGGRPRLGRTAL